MGGRGASSGMSEKGKPYGSEFRTLLKAGNVKFVKQNAALNAKDPLETMTKGRIYVTINDEGKINAISYYGADGKRVKQSIFCIAMSNSRECIRTSGIITMKAEQEH